jgi:hypothetical protein
LNWVRRSRSIYSAAATGTLSSICRPPARQLPWRRPRTLLEFSLNHYSRYRRGSGLGWLEVQRDGSRFADRTITAYFYTESRTMRRRYDPLTPCDAHAGNKILLSLTRSFPHCGISALLRQDLRGGARFAASSLVKSDNYRSGGLGVTWIICQSAGTVVRDD